MAQRLHEVAAEQGGYFTARQALTAGYSPSAQSYNVEAGNWIRERRGILRLATYPLPGRPDLILWSLWSSNRKGVPEGVFSHATALSVYELSDLNPAKLHMTVPPGFRRSAPPPQGLVLHKARLHPEDTRAMHGFKVTQPLRTISDMVLEGVTEEGLLRQAVNQALERGLISFGEIDKAVRIPPGVKERIRALAR